MLNRMHPGEVRHVWVLRRPDHQVHLLPEPPRRHAEHPGEKLGAQTPGLCGEIDRVYLYTLFTPTKCLQL